MKTGDGMVPFCGEIEAGVHRLAVRIYYADTDCGGVVYHGRYLEFLERGRTEFLRQAGIHHHELAAGKHSEALIWVVRRMDIDYITPARIDDVLTIETRIISLSGARIHLQQQAMRGEQPLINAKVEVALINRAGRPRRLPASWVETLQR